MPIRLYSFHIGLRASAMLAQSHTSVHSIHVAHGPIGTLLRCEQHEASLHRTSHHQCARNSHGGGLPVWRYEAQKYLDPAAVGMSVVRNPDHIGLMGAA